MGEVLCELLCSNYFFLKQYKIYNAFGRLRSGSSVEEKSVDCRVETRCRAEGRKLKERKERRKRSIKERMRWKREER